MSYVIICLLTSGKIIIIKLNEVYLYCFIVNISFSPTTFRSFISSFIVLSSIKHLA